MVFEGAGGGDGEVAASCVIGDGAAENQPSLLYDVRPERKAKNNVALVGRCVFEIRFLPVRCGLVPARSDREMPGTL